MVDSRLCTGCGVCQLLCPTSGIHMEENAEGFLYPKVNENLCINCGKCEQCHINASEKENISEVYAVVSRNTYEMVNSSSGGVFSVLARRILSENGLVVGCEVSGHDVRHIIIDSENELHKLQGSKYVESEISNVLPEVKKQLESGKIILFSGTGCQIAAAKSFLGDCDKIVFFEILCHGVPSRLLFDMHMKYTEEKYGSKVKKIRFRSKMRSNWGMSYGFEYEFENGKKAYLPSCEDVYYINFLKGNIMRESCYKCKYAGEERVGDIIGGDYWGVEKHHKEIDSLNGVSIVGICSDVGKQLFEACKDELIIYPTQLKYAKEQLHALVSPLNRPAQRDSIYEMILDNGYAVWNSMYHKSSVYAKEKTKFLIKSFLPQRLKVFTSDLYRKVKEVGREVK